MIFALLVSVALGLVAEPHFARVPLTEATVSFATFKAHFEKDYGSLAEESHRRKIYLDNVDTIIAHNEKNLGWTMGVNEFADIHPDEFFATYLNNTFRHKQENVQLLETSGSPDSVDWVTSGAVTPVKNQGSCGSCWAFSTTGSVEGAWKIKHGELVSLSEEELVQCDRGQDSGCQGGLMDYAFQFIEKHGITSESNYPYTSGSGVRGSCSSAKEAQPVATVSGYKDVTQNSADQMKAALALGPVSVAVEADKSAWQFYSGGIMSSESCGTNLDHGVLAVGFDSTSGYFKVKNSWGTSWGEAGYIRLADTSRNAAGICGILSSASYPIAGDKPGPGPSPGPTPTPGPGPATSEHYGDPKNGCPSGDASIQIQGVSGDFCSPKCVLGFICPGTPADLEGTPQCALQDQSGDKYCALMCSGNGDSCGNAGDTCKSIQGTGICTWDD